MVALIISSQEIISSLFGYGSFDQTSVINSANALFYFALGLPAFSLIKVFSSFSFARHNTKQPFIFSLLSVCLNIFISVYFFKDFGFIIIAISTSISSWFNATLLYLFLHKKKYFIFETTLIKTFSKILISSLLMGLLLYYLVNNLENYLNYNSDFKLVVILILIFVSMAFYFILSIAIKAFAA